MKDAYNNPFLELDQKLDLVRDEVTDLKNEIIGKSPRKEIMTIEEVEAYTMLKQSTIRKHERSGKLKSYRQSGRLYFRLADIIDWLTQNQTDRISSEELKKRKERIKEIRSQETLKNLHRIKDCDT